MLKFSEVNNFYVFVNTTNENIIRKVKVLTSGLKFLQFGTALQENKISGIFYKNSFQAGNNLFFNFEKINDLQDYNLALFDYQSSPHLDNSFDSIISYCFIRENRFVAGTDYRSFLHHYYYYEKDTFICSNSMFAVAKLSNDTLSEEAIFETLFFRFPFRNNTYFKAVKSLGPYQQLSFTENEGLKTSTAVHYDDLIMHDDIDIEEGIEYFFSKLNYPSNLSPVISFSGGSDSVALLAILKKNGVNCKLASFNGHSEWDTNRIKKLSKKTGYPLIYIDLGTLESSINDELQYAFLTNGFLLSIHFNYFYKSLPEKFQIFDGMSIMLGDMSDATLYPPYKEVLQGIPLDTVLEKYLSGFNSQFINRMKEYLYTNYSEQFHNINTKEGLQNMKQFSVEGPISKLYSSVIKCTTNYGHENVCFYHSRRFMSFIEKNGYGISRTCTGRDDYPGYVVNRKPLGLIVQKMDDQIYGLKLDKGISFKDINENSRYLTLKKKIKTLDQQIFNFKNRRTAVFPPKEVIKPGYFEFIDPKADLNFYSKASLSIFTCLKSVMDGIEI